MGDHGSAKERPFCNCGLIGTSLHSPLSITPPGKAFSGVGGIYLFVWRRGERRPRTFCRNWLFPSWANPPGNSDPSPHLGFVPPYVLPTREFGSGKFGRRLLSKNKQMANLGPTSMENTCSFTKAAFSFLSFFFFFGTFATQEVLPQGSDMFNTTFQTALQPP